ncbi:hypothetical protein SBADM41S_03733 [Streptomyces badius]
MIGRTTDWMTSSTFLVRWRRLLRMSTTQSPAARTNSGRALGATAWFMRSLL